MLTVHELPYLTQAVPGIGGRIKARAEDFVVEEVPLYEPCGEGTHVYFRVEKRGLTTMRAVELLARDLGRPVRDFGYAGLKDANALTTQTISLEHVDAARVEAVSIPGIRVLQTARHTNKIKIGHLAGNHFAIKVRDVDPARADDVRAMMDTLARRGVPNYFGPQRFGMRGDTWQIGRASLRNNCDEALAVMLGRPGPADHGDVRRARELFDLQDYARAAETWPYPFSNERRVCRALAGSSGNARKAWRAVDRKLKQLYISAYQSYLFNQVVAGRIDGLDRLMLGDLAWKHDNGAVFRVEDLAVEQPRCDAFEISPSGPLFGYRMTMPDGDPGRIEQSLLAAENMTLDDWREAGLHKIKGARRPLRFKPAEWEVNAATDASGPYIELRFLLDPGSYATTVLREICKSDPAPITPDD